MKTRIELRIGDFVFLGSAPSMSEALRIVEDICGFDVFPPETDVDCVVAVSHADGVSWRLG